MTMFKSYLHIAARHLTRHRLYALTNVGGLAVGLAGCMLMAIWVLGQLETDRFHEHGERIYRVVTEGEKATRLTTPAVLGTSLQREATAVEAVVRMLKWTTQCRSSATGRSVSTKTPFSSPTRRF